MTDCIVRIAQMEALFTRCEEAVRQLRHALENGEYSMLDLTNFVSDHKVLKFDFKDYTPPSLSLLNYLAQITDSKYLTPTFLPLNPLTQIADFKDLTSLLSTLRSAISILEAYYTSHVWRADFEADEAGLLPPDLKCGVLSEDGINNLLEEYKRVEEGVKEMLWKK